MPSAQIRLKLIGFDENSAPDNFAGLANSFQRSTTKREVHRRLTLTRCAAITVHEMVRWGGCRNFKGPDELVVILRAKGGIVQTCFEVSVQLFPCAVVATVL